MTAKRYRKRPVEIEALQWTGDNLAQMQAFVGVRTDSHALENEQGFDVFRAGPRLYVAANEAWLPIDVSEWVAKDRLGFYPIKDSMFHESYELVV